MILLGHLQSLALNLRPKVGAGPRVDERERKFVDSKPEGSNGT